MIAAVRRWATWLRVVHGRRPLLVAQRQPLSLNQTTPADRPAFDWRT